MMTQPRDVERGSRCPSADSPDRQRRPFCGPSGAARLPGELEPRKHKPRMGYGHCCAVLGAGAEVQADAAGREPGFMLTRNRRMGSGDSDACALRSTAAWDAFPALGRWAVA